MNDYEVKTENSEEIHNAADRIKRTTRRKRWHKAVSVMAAMVVFCTTYALVLPAITVSCDKVEHTHTEECYSEQMFLVCQEENHEHTDSCYEVQNLLICEMEEHCHETDDEPVSLLAPITALFDSNEADDGDAEITEDSNDSEEMMREWLDEPGLAYISESSVLVYDGAGTFDTSTNPSAPDYYLRDGNDGGQFNGRVRSYDKIIYEVNFETKCFDPADKITAGYLWYEVYIPLNKNKVIFDTDDVMRPLGTKVDSMSALMAEDTEATIGTSRYYIEQTNDYQKLTGRLIMSPDVTPNAIPGGKSFNLAFIVLNMYKGESITPEIKLWLDHDAEADYVELNDSDYYYLDADNNKCVRPWGATTDVTSQLRLNIKFAEATTKNFEDVFDFGNIPEACNSSAGKVDGIMRAYGLTLMLCNDNCLDDRGLKGCEIPNGEPITFDIEIGNVKYLPENSENTVDLTADDNIVPIMWALTKNNKDGSNGAVSNEYSSTMRSNNDYLTGEHANSAPQAFSSKAMNVVNGESAACQGGGKWHGVQEGNIIHVTVENYCKGETTTPQAYTHFPNVDAGYTGAFNGEYYRIKDYFQKVNGAWTYINSDAKIAYHNLSGTMSPGNLGMNMGCFTSGKLMLVLPKAAAGGTTIRDKYGEGSLTFLMTDYNLRAESVCAASTPLKHDDDSLVQIIEPKNATESADDVVSTTYSITNKGTYDNIVWYSNVANGGQYDIDDTTEHKTDGGDIAALGQTGSSITWGHTATPMSRMAAVFAANDLLKFDDRAIEIIGSPHEGPSNWSTYTDTHTIKYFYAAKPDGKAWTSDDEMNKTEDDELIYFASLDELKSTLGEDAHCVGIMAELRETTKAIYGYYYNYFNYVPIRIKTDPSLVGKVYQVRNSVRIWTQKDFDELGGVEGFPSLSEKERGKNYSIIDPDQNENTTVYRNNTNFRKSEYSSDGVIRYTSNSNLRRDGDSLYLVNFSVKINKQLMKTENGKTKTTFSLDSINPIDKSVDYCLKTTLGFDSTKINYEGTKAIVTITDTIDRGLVYNNNAYLGTEYLDEALETTDKAKYAQDAPGAFMGYIEPTSIKLNDKGQTVITWVLEGCEVGKTMPNIYYSCGFSKNPADQDCFKHDLKNVASISATGDQCEIVAKSGIDANVSITPLGVNAYNLGKFTVKRVNENTDDLKWTLYIGNNSNNIKSNEIWLDVLPYNGDAYGSDFNFPIWVNSFIIDKSAAISDSSISKWTAYYTTDTAVRGMLADDFMLVNGNIVEKDGSSDILWHPITIDVASGEISGLPARGTTQPTALLINGHLEAHEAFKAEVSVQTNNASVLPQGGDELVNSLSKGTQVTTDYLYVVSRSIGGLCWYDDNIDGIRTGDENLLTDDETGIVATLKVKNASGEYVDMRDKDGKLMQITLGQKMSYATGQKSDHDDGKYLFTDLPAGTYAVVFTPTDSNEEFENWISSPANNPETSDLSDSDAIPNYNKIIENIDEKLINAVIEGIELERAEEMLSPVISKTDNDAGFACPLGGIVRLLKVDEDSASAVENAEFSLYPAVQGSNGVWNVEGEPELTSTGEWDGDDAKAYAVGASDGDGRINFNNDCKTRAGAQDGYRNIAPGYYILKETEFPAGYYENNKLYLVTVHRDGSVIITDTNGDTLTTAGDDLAYVITNQAGTVLPDAGGIGTTIFYVMGGLLAVGAAVVLVSKKRMSAEG